MRALCFILLALPATDELEGLSVEIGQTGMFAT